MKITSDQIERLVREEVDKVIKEHGTDPESELGMMDELDELCADMRESAKSDKYKIPFHIKKYHTGGSGRKDWKQHVMKKKEGA